MRFWDHYLEPSLWRSMVEAAWAGNYSRLKGLIPAFLPKRYAVIVPHLFATN
jgi:hypothetical protein